MWHIWAMDLEIIFSILEQFEEGTETFFGIIFDITILFILNTLTTSYVKPFIRHHPRAVHLFTRIDHMPIEKSSSSEL